MQEGDVILTPIPQANGQIKNRPAILLRAMPPFQDFLVCGISTRLQQEVRGFDEVIDSVDSDFKTSGVIAPSLIRLGFLSIIPRKNIVGTIGNIARERHTRLLRNLSAYLTEHLPK